MNNIVNNKRIAKNTLLLYIRTLLLMAISLYTSRVILKILGIENYGIYNVVGGVVTMFAVVSGALSSAISRYITFELGKGEITNLQKVFSMSINIQIGISIIVFILGELVGGWFLNYKMNIPIDRITAANFVLQCSLITFIINLISIPYNACIIAHEQMGAFAYISLLEAILKLLSVYVLATFSYDKLSMYAILLVFISIIIRFIYRYYCKKHFPESHYKFIFDKKLLREMISFAGWSFLGHAAYIFNTQGVNILMNLFFGVSFNAARGIVTQVESAVLQFVNNFTVAVNPQITKSYASGDLNYMFTLVCKGTKYAYFLLLIIVLPIIFESNQVLQIWLGIVPNEAPTFLRLALIGSLMFILGNTIVTAVSATGRIKKYQTWITTIGCLVFPLTWAGYKLGLPAYASYIIYTFIYFCLIFVRLYLFQELFHYSIRIFIKQVLLRLAGVSIISIILPLIVFNILNESILRFIITFITCLISTFISIYCIGLDYKEKLFFIERIKIYILSKHKRSI